MLVGFAVKVTLGATLTSTDCVAEPPAPVHISVKVPELVRLLRVSLPDVALVPVHAPDAVHVVALVLDQLSVVEPLYATESELALSVSVGTGAAATVIVTLLETLPPEPEHSNV